VNPSTLNYYTIQQRTRETLEEKISPEDLQRFFREKLGALGEFFPTDLNSGDIGIGADGKLVFLSYGFDCKSAAGKEHEEFKSFADMLNANQVVFQQALDDIQATLEKNNTT
jgi:hypothetical protein